MSDPRPLRGGGRARRGIERAFRQTREALGVRTSFPREVQRAAEQAAADDSWRREEREDLTAVPFVTIDPPGSRDLDQALHLEAEGDGLRLLYAIADVGAFIERGSPVEEEAWRRGVTYYSPDRRDPLYPPVISQGVASLLPDGPRPAIVFDLLLDARGELTSAQVECAVVHSRAQLTYHEALHHIEEGAFDNEPFAVSLSLLRDFGELRLERERSRGGVSLPILDQHVERSAARRLGYELVYETPNVAESWNAQVSLLAGHAAARLMAAGGAGLLRTMPPPRREEVERLRVVARALGFDWPEERSYAEFLHSVNPAQPNVQVLVWQARRLMRGAGYETFRSGEGPLPEHSAIALPYAHCTAPLRRLADRYVLDLLVRYRRGDSPTRDELETLGRLPAAMQEAGRRSGQLERRVLDIAEAWQLREREGFEFDARVISVRDGGFEGQLEEVPVRAWVETRKGVEIPSLGEEVRVRLVGVRVEEGELDFSLVEAGEGRAP